jgi:type II secretory pathway pseudopilin PulG
VKIKSSARPGSSEANESGFSLIELLVVMVVTFFVSGAIYGLLASGQNSFSREPEMADRQQNIRIAMDVITKDVANAGTNLPAFVQVFTVSDPAGGPALNGLGPAGSMGNAALSTNSDVLEILAAEDRCPASTVCNAFASGAAGTYATKEKNASCLAPVGVVNPGFAVLTNNNVMTIQPITGPNPQPCLDGGSGNNGGVNLGPAVAVGSNLLTNPVAPAPFTAPAIGASIHAFLFPARISRYTIGYDPGDPDRVPLLFRSVTGRYTAAGALSVPPPAVATPPGAPPSVEWQVIARGIEDLQVEYQDGLGNWTNSPPVAVPCGPPGVAGGCANQLAFNAIVRQVRVTLSARVTTQGLQGSQSAGAGSAIAPDRIRGQLVSIIQPRSAMISLELGNQVR